MGANTSSNFTSDCPAQRARDRQAGARAGSQSVKPIASTNRAARASCWLPIFWHGVELEQERPALAHEMQRGRLELSAPVAHVYIRLMPRRTS